MKPRLPILMYHGIVIKGESSTNLSYTIDGKSSIDPIYTIDAEAFGQQMEYLFNNGYETISLHDLIAFRHGHSGLPDNPIIITFDDGFLSDYTVVYPILKKHGFGATFFVTVGRIGQPSMMNWQMIRELFSDGMEIGSHSLTHPYPNQLSDECLEYELSESKRRLDEKLITNIDIFSSPTGDYNKATSRIAKELGYRTVCSSSVGGNGIKSNSFCLKRIAIKRQYDISTFESIAKLEWNMIFRLRALQLVRDGCRKALGPGIYKILRRHLLRGGVPKRSD